MDTGAHNEFESADQSAEPKLFLEHLRRSAYPEDQCALDFAKARSGDAEALSNLVRGLRPTLAYRAYIIRPSESEDLLQIALVKVCDVVVRAKKRATHVRWYLLKCGIRAMMAEVVRLQKASAPLDPLEQEEEDGVVSSINIVDGHPEPSEQVEYSELREAVSRLEPRSREVVIGVFGLGSKRMTLRSFASRFLVTEARAHQIEKSAIYKLRTEKYSDVVPASSSKVIRKGNSPMLTRLKEFKTYLIALVLCRIARRNASCATKFTLLKYIALNLRKNSDAWRDLRPNLRAVIIADEALALCKEADFILIRDAGRTRAISGSGMFQIRSIDEQQKLGVFSETFAKLISQCLMENRK